MDAVVFAYLLILAYLLLAFYSRIVKSLIYKNREFKCSNCTKCCKLIVKLSDKDVKRIRTDVDYIEESRGRKTIKQVNGYCIFLNVKEGKSSCSIYGMRPDICRNFPKTKVLGISANDSRCNGFK